MVKYLGSKITAFAAVIIPMFILFPLLFGINILITEISVATIFLFIMCALCTAVWAIYVNRDKKQLYSWGRFSDNEVKVVTGFRKATKIEYKSCLGCGIGYYTHGVLNSHLGTKVYFIFLSYDRFDECFRTKINRWKPSDTKIKVQFSKELYTYLLEVLPKSQARMLIKDYEKYLANDKK